jgi:hypothetical protein
VTGPVLETGFPLQKKNWDNYPMDVESKWSYLPITPTYDQYVHRWVVMSESEGFHLKTRSTMKELLEDAKWKVLSDKRKKCELFKIRVDS